MESRLSQWRKYLPTAKQVLAAVVATQLMVAVPARANDGNSNDGKTTSPIKHVIIIIGENRSFDHVFATYVPKKGQTVDNLLSKGIVNADGTAWSELRVVGTEQRRRLGRAILDRPGGKAAYTSIPIATRRRTGICHRDMRRHFFRWQLQRKRKPDCFQPTTSIF